MTVDAFAKLRELAERATRGPFEARPGRGEVLSRDAEATALMREMHFAHSNAWDSLEQREKDFQNWYDGAFLFAESMTSANAEYVAELANRAPELLAEVESLRARVARHESGTGLLGGGERMRERAEKAEADLARLRRLADAELAFRAQLDQMPYLEEAAIPEAERELNRLQQALDVEVDVERAARNSSALAAMVERAARSRTT